MCLGRKSNVSDTDQALGIYCRYTNLDERAEQLALTEAAYTTVRLMQKFSAIKSQDSKPWTECLTLTCCSNDGTRISLTPAGEANK